MRSINSLSKDITPAVLSSISDQVFTLYWFLSAITRSIIALVLEKSSLDYFSFSNCPLVANIEHSLSSSSVFNPLQFDFVPDHTIETALAKVTHDFHGAKTSGQFSIPIICTQVQFGRLS